MTLATLTIFPLRLTLTARALRLLALTSSSAVTGSITLSIVSGFDSLFSSQFHFPSLRAPWTLVGSAPTSGLPRLVTPAHPHEQLSANAYAMDEPDMSAVVAIRASGGSGRLLGQLATISQCSYV
jgi:hypothetical protein